MGIFSNAARKFWAAYCEGLTMSCPAECAKKKAAKVARKAKKRREQIHAAVAAQKGKVPGHRKAKREHPA